MRPLAMLAAVALIIAPACTKHKETPADMPWQVTLTDESVTVMGVTLGATNADEAMRRFNAEPEIVLYVDKEGTPTREAYYGKVALGGLSGTLIANLATDVAWASDAKKRAVKIERSANGDEKIILATGDYRDSLRAIIAALTYLPSIHLDEATIRARFGEPATVVEGTGALRYFLYPTKGTVVTLDPHGKESVQYVIPASFETMVTKATAGSAKAP